MALHVGRAGDKFGLYTRNTRQLPRHSAGHIPHSHDKGRRVLLADVYYIGDEYNLPSKHVVIVYLFSSSIWRWASV